MSDELGKTGANNMRKDSTSARSLQLDSVRCSHDSSPAQRKTSGTLENDFRDSVAAFIINERWTFSFSSLL